MLRKIHHQVQTARKSRAYSQSDLAHLLGIKHRDIEKLESGKREPSLAEALILATIFESEARALISDLVEEIKADLYIRLSEIVEKTSQPTFGYRRHANLLALKTELERVHEEGC